MNWYKRYILSQQTVTERPLTYLDIGHSDYEGKYDNPQPNILWVLADGYVQARSKNYLLIRTSFRPRPFPFPKAWLDHMTNADYIDIIADYIIKLIRKKASGVYNVGTEIKTLYGLANKTIKDCKPILDDYKFIRPKDVTMNINKLKKKLKNEF